jgi:cytochrome b
MKTHYLIWDLPLRLFHWLLVSTFFSLWITAELGSEYMQYHMYCGYFMLFLLCFRIIWGIVGTTHSRFLSFIPTWPRLKSYLKPSSTYDKLKPAGHNPLGAGMVFLMLLLLSAQAISGLFITDDVYSSGPYYGTLEGDWEKLFKRLHDVCFALLQACVALHISAIAFYKIAKKKSLVLPMLTGKKSSKDVNANDAINGSKLILALLVTAVVAAFIYWLVVINVPAAEDYYYY